MRGSIHLAAAVISPSDEDSNTFTVNSTSGELFKLRAGDARARQDWVNRLRAVAEMHTIAIAQVVLHSIVWIDFSLACSLSNQKIVFDS